MLHVWHPASLWLQWNPATFIDGGQIRRAGDLLMMQSEQRQDRLHTARRSQQVSDPAFHAETLWHVGAERQLNASCFSKIVRFRTCPVQTQNIRGASSQCQRASEDLADHRTTFINLRHPGGIVEPTSSDDSRDRIRTAGTGMGTGFEHRDTSTFAHDKPVTGLIERTTGCCSITVAGCHAQTMERGQYR